MTAEFIMHQPRNIYGSKPYVETPAVDNEDDGAINIPINAMDGSDIKWWLVVMVEFIIRGRHGNYTDISARQRTNWGEECNQLLQGHTLYSR